MTKDGFMLLVMGFTGKPAMATKIAFINAFNWMAEQLTAARPAHGLTHDELHSLAWLWRAADRMMIAAKAICPLLDVAEHREAGTYYSIIHEYPMTLQRAQQVLADKTRDLPPALYTDEASNWARVLRPLHDQPRQISQSLRLR